MSEKAHRRSVLKDGKSDKSFIDKNNIVIGPFLSIDPAKSLCNLYLDAKTVLKRYQISSITLNTRVMRMFLPEEYLLPLALYAEIHFRFFRGMPSLLFRREPEILFDIPRRVVSGADLPLVLLLNDIHKYPVHPESVRVAVSQSGCEPKLLSFKELEKFRISHPLESQMLAYTIPIPRSELPEGEIFLNARLNYRRIRKGKPKGSLQTVLNDNLPTSTKLPYRCNVTDLEFPGNKYCTFGDLHCHSLFSRSHVEFGPPLEIIKQVARASGLHFVAITDHSYDLACRPDNYLEQDRNLGMWKLFKQSFETARVNSEDVVLMQGEEVSCLNGKGKVVHLCGLGIKEFIPGTLDGARPNTVFNTQPTVIEAVRMIHRQGGLAFAAHPGARTGFMQEVFLNRGEWSESDLFDDLEGIQAVNSGFLASWQRGKKLWISMLQRGIRVPLLAGSDAHGDFNRYRAVGKPFVQIHEGPERYMGFVRTGLYGSYSTQREILDAVRRCATYVTNGPFAAINATGSRGDSLISSKSVENPQKLYAVASSTEEFGQIERIRVFCGQRGSGEEKVVLSRECPKECYFYSEKIPAQSLPGRCYLRVEVNGKTGRGIETIAATSGCFVEKGGG